jgi:hypothetical protein
MIPGIIKSLFNFIKIIKLSKIAYYKDKNIMKGFIKLNLFLDLKKSKSGSPLLRFKEADLGLLLYNQIL